MKTLLTLALLAATPVAADIDVTFREGAPKDRFTFTNAGACALGAAVLELDMSGSAAGLIFDTTGSGAGVEVFQPYETVAGGDVIGKVSPVSDGDNTITLSLTDLAPGQSVAFTIDVDDTLQDGALGQIRVANSEIAGATVRLTAADGQSASTFDTSSRATIKTARCTS